jgi:hypothetical protein
MADRTPASMLSAYTLCSTSYGLTPARRLDPSHGYAFAVQDVILLCFIAAILEQLHVTLVFRPGVAVLLINLWRPSWLLFFCLRRSLGCVSWCGRLGSLRSCLMHCLRLLPHLLVGSSGSSSSSRASIVSIAICEKVPGCLLRKVFAQRHDPLHDSCGTPLQLRQQQRCKCSIAGICTATLIHIFCFPQHVWIHRDGHEQQETTLHSPSSSGGWGAGGARISGGGGGGEGGLPGHG